MASALVVDTGRRRVREGAKADAHPLEGLRLRQLTSLERFDTPHIED